MANAPSEFGRQFQTLAGTTARPVSRRCPTEIVEATSSIIAAWERHALIISGTGPFGRAQEAWVLAATPGAADKAVVTL